MALIKVFINLFCLRAKPSDIPYSKVLLGCLAIAVFVAKNCANLLFVNLVKSHDQHLVANLSLMYSGLMVGVYFLLMIACVRTALSYYKVPERALQIMSALLSVDLLMTLLFIVWVFGLSELSLPLQADSIVSIAMIVIFILLMYWQFLVYINIFFNGMPISVLRAGVFALVYLLLQHNIAELLMSLVIQMDDKVG